RRPGALTRRTAACLCCRLGAAGRTTRGGLRGGRTTLGGVRLAGGSGLLSGRLAFGSALGSHGVSRSNSFQSRDSRPRPSPLAYPSAWPGNAILGGPVETAPYTSDLAAALAGD